MHRLVFLTLFATTTLFARIDHVDITSRTDYLGGKSFGLAGAYERIQGRAYFVVDPANAHDRVIVDLDKAPRNAKGEVAFSADVDLLVPKKGGNGTLSSTSPTAVDVSLSATRARMSTTCGKGTRSPRWDGSSTCGRIRNCCGSTRRSRAESPAASARTSSSSRRHSTIPSVM